MPNLDLPKFELPKIDLKGVDVPEVAAKPLYAGVGATDLAVEKVVAYAIDMQIKVANKVTEVQKSVKDFELPKPKSLQEKAVASYADSKSKAEARIAEMSADAKSFPIKVQEGVKTRYDENVATVSTTYAGLAKRGEAVVVKLRGEVADAAGDAVATVEPSTGEKAAATRALKETAPKKATAKKTPAKKAPAKKATAKKAAPAKKTTTTKTTSSGTTSTPSNGTSGS